MAKKNQDSTLHRLLRTDEMSVFIPLLIIMAITTIFRPDFLTVKNFSAIFTQIPFIAIVALGVSFPLMTGNIDISTGRVAGFAGIIMASLCYEHGWSIFPAGLLPSPALLETFPSPPFTSWMGRWAERLPPCWGFWQRCYQRAG